MMKISPDKYDELDDLTIKICNLVRNMVYSAYDKNDYDKAISNCEELLDIAKNELETYKSLKSK